MSRVQTIVTAPTALPVSVAEAKSQSIVSSDADDTLIYRLISAATASVEQYLQRKLVTQTWKMFRDDWGEYDRFPVLFGDLQSVTHVKYKDTDETQSTFSTDYYFVDTDSVPGLVILKYGQAWPTDVLSPRNPIEIQFVTGYSTSTTVSKAYFDGSGLNDLTPGGTFSGTSITDYIVQIDTAAGTDKFKWSSDGGTTYTANVSITGAAQTLSNGVTVNFGATTGHTLNDRWDFRAGDAIPNDIKHAVMWLVTHFYENREFVIIDKMGGTLPEGFLSLLTPHKVWEWSA